MQVYCNFSKCWPDVEGYRRLGFAVGSSGAFNKLYSVLSFFWFALVVRYFIVRGYSLDVYIPHPGNILSNYLFFSRASGSRLYLYEDGILNYYDATARNPFVGRFKKIIAWLGGMRYHEYSGHLAGYDAGVFDGAFLSRPNLAVRKSRLGEVFHLPPVAKPIVPTPGVILFLDQNVADCLTEAEREKYLAEMFSVFPADEYSYFYKSHHDFSSPASTLMRGLTAEQSLLPAEVVVGVLKPSHVISFYSSALINIKMSNPGVECVSLAACKIPVLVDGVAGCLSDLFECCDVRDLKCISGDM